MQGQHKNQYTYYSQVFCIHDNMNQWITQHRLKPNESVSTLIPLVGLKKIDLG